MSEMHETWPFREAERILERLEHRDASDEPVVFETGFGPSGLPHIGTFSEVARTTWVRWAFEALSDRDTKLIVFSDDMDGLRDVPENVPQGDMLFEHLGRPLCDVPDPFEEAESFAAHMNGKLREFLDSFGFDYTFESSREQYRSGRFDEGLERILERHQEIRDVIVPTLREWRRDRWSPFFPVCQECGKVYTTRVVDVDPEDGTIAYECEKDRKGMQPCGDSGRVPVTGGSVKVGWKIDWALRWHSFGVDYEMYGKDLIESAELSGEIVDILGSEPPEGSFYEMFLDENGQKISKSVGTGLSIDEWLEYGPLESLAWFIFQNPQKAKKLYFEVIPESIDDWLEARAAFGDLDGEEARRDHPVWFVEHDRALSDETTIDFSSDVTFSMLLNLASALNTDDRELIWNYVLDYDPSAEEDRDVVETMLDGVLAYYRDFVLPTKEYRSPSDDLVEYVREFRDFLADYEGGDPEEIQNKAYELGNESGVSLGEWFQTMYRLLLGQDQGPRLGSFVHMFGIESTIEAIDERLEG
jgi:lysyl-tRNA synthetase class 1